MDLIEWEQGKHLALPGCNYFDNLTLASSTDRMTARVCRSHCNKKGAIVADQAANLLRQVVSGEVEITIEGLGTMPWKGGSGKPEIINVPILGPTPITSNVAGEPLAMMVGGVECCLSRQTINTKDTYTRYEVIDWDPEEKKLHVRRVR